ncbi:calcium/calmodulin-dependent 3',5'-cyclic nucleotide phosphodiesterase 1A-like isoform X4 [Alosa sapidissima]|uniref:calcium/calmodulin-dependent 3',5'-cyclic nucleotide phosphodiesterase 1A-like isoform X4 n=1 Tax=Alosa sapidissima TaxID=34773 RepID=UPI001C08EEE2|nr:calcium/calmodulin-dependent 3',5'-cyclic nucleotide phosphodiesterase 1A-like isoform X4 [Alosa sapidissima]
MSFCLVDYFDMESPTKEIEDFENNSLKYLQPDQIEKIWLRLRGLRKYKKTSQRLRCLVKQLERGEASVVDLKKNLEYAATVLESVYIEETRRLVDTEDELSDIQSDSVPSEVRDWLAATFTRQMGLMLRRTEEKPRFRSIVHAVQAGIFVERMYRRTSNMVGLSYPPSVITVLKHVDTWTFDVFALNDASGDHALKFIFYELLTRYDLINRFKIPISALVSFVEALEVGYSKHKNPYHNLMHAADVTQTVHFFMLKSGIVHWMTELEIFALIFAAAVHDYEHTGTTNNFHIQTRSDMAIFYNDRAVQENHHVSAAYRLLQDDDEMNILYNLSKDDWRELRALVVEMVLATDMSCHFQQIKAMKNFLQQPEAIDKTKALSLLLHTADISHPAKNWDLHHRWTTSLLEEFFRQGDKESELGLVFSPLCDRKSTMVAQSQIGFIDFIVEPTFTVLTDMTEKIVTPLIDEASRSGLAGFRRSRSGLNNISPDGKRSSVKSTGSEGSTSLNCSLLTVDFKSFKSTWNEEVQQNREKWKAQATKDLEEKAKREAEEKAKLEEAEGKKEEGKESETSDPAQDKDTRATKDTKDTAESTDKEEKEREREKEKEKEKEREKEKEKEKEKVKEKGKTEERKPEPAGTEGEGAQAMKDPVEQKPKEAEGNKDPGGSQGTKPEPDPQEASGPKQPATHSNTDSSGQQVQNGEVPKELDSPESEGSEKKTSSSDDSDEDGQSNIPGSLAAASASAASASDAN